MMTWIKLEMGDTNWRRPGIVTWLAYLEPDGNISSYPWWPYYQSCIMPLFISIDLFFSRYSSKQQEGYCLVFHKINNWLKGKRESNREVAIAISTIWLGCQASVLEWSLEHPWSTLEGFLDPIPAEVSAYTSRVHCSDLRGLNIVYRVGMLQLLLQ